jgi:hypothetical protein
MSREMSSIFKNYLSAGIALLVCAIGLASLICGIMEFNRFVTADTRYNQLVSLHMALSRFHEKNGRFPAIRQNGTGDSSLESWRDQILPYVFWGIQHSEDKNEEARAFKSTPLIAVLNSNGSVWDKDAVGTHAELAHRYGNPIIVVYAPNMTADGESSHEMIIEKSKISFQPSGKSVSIDDLQGGFALRRYGTVETIPSFANEQQLYEYLSSKEWLP